MPIPKYIRLCNSSGSPPENAGWQKEWNWQGKSNVVLPFFDNNRCCNPSCITVKAHICSQDFALLARGLKQCYFHKPLLSLLQLCSHFMQMFHVMLRSNRRVMNTVTRCHRAFNMPPTLNIFQTLTDTFLFITLICKYSDSRASRRHSYFFCTCCQIITFMTSALFSILFISVAVTKLPCWGHSDSDYSGKSGREHMKAKREVYQKTEWHRGKERERNPKHYFWQPLQASPSVTLITIQLWEKGYSIQHSGAQPGSCSSVGQARAPPLSQVCAFGCLCSLTYASVPLKKIFK